jgi:hypothetical protein
LCHPDGTSIPNVPCLDDFHRVSDDVPEIEGFHEESCVREAKESSGFSIRHDAPLPAPPTAYSESHFTSLTRNTSCGCMPKRASISFP